MSRLCQCVIGKRGDSIRASACSSTSGRFQTGGGGTGRARFKADSSQIAPVRCGPRTPGIMQPRAPKSPLPPVRSRSRPEYRHRLTQTGSREAPPRSMAAHAVARPTGAFAAKRADARARRRLTACPIRATSQHLPASAGSCTPPRSKCAAF